MRTCPSLCSLVPKRQDLLDRGRRDAVKWAASVGLISFLALRQPGAAASAAVGSAAGSSATCKAAAAQEQQRLSSHSIVVDAEAQEDADNEAAAAAVAAEYVRCAVLASVATPVPAAAK